MKRWKKRRKNKEKRVGYKMITQREALKALLDGKVVKMNDHVYKMDGDRIKSRYRYDSIWKEVGWLSEVTEIFESYEMTFSEAYSEMKQGKKVVRESEPDMYYYIANLASATDMSKRIFFRPTDESEPGRLAYININALEDKWRVLG